MTNETEDSPVSPTRHEEDFAEVSLRPSLLQEFVGQDSIKEKLRLFIDAARRRSESLDHVLVYGPPGLGKTSLAYIIVGHAVHHRNVIEERYLSA